MVQIMQEGACQAAGKKTGRDFRPAPCSFFLGSNSSERAQGDHIFLESWEPLRGRGQGLLSSWEEEEREK